MQRCTTSHWRQKLYTQIRCFAQSTTNEGKPFTKSLLLPKTSFPLRPQPAVSELPFRKKTTEDLYLWQKENVNGPLYVLHDGPPYANGNLHMGHALNKILKDIIIRFHLSRGRKVHYVPGWDCHGLPIENKAVKELKIDFYGEEEVKQIRSTAKKVATREIQIQREEFQNLSILADWSEQGTYRTLDHNYTIRQLRIFYKMVAKGLIYKGYRPTYFSPSSRTALAEAELVYRDDHLSRSVYITVPVILTEKLLGKLGNFLGPKPTLQLLIWTTTPWTLTANMAIALNSTMEYTVLKTAVQNSDRSQYNYYLVAADRKDALLEKLQLLHNAEEVITISGSDFVNCQYPSLFTTNGNDKSPIIFADFVDNQTGTGIVHCAPSHGPDDYRVCGEYNIISERDPPTTSVDSSGKFAHNITEDFPDIGPRLAGKDVLKEGTKTMIDILDEMGYLVQQEDIKHRYPYDWKTNEPVLILATQQWFCDLSKIKDKVLNSLKNVKFYPPSSRNRLESFIRSRSEWCISRQRAWGVPIPILYNTTLKKYFLDQETFDQTIEILEKRGIQAWWDSDIDEYIPKHLKDATDRDSWRKERDTMDVWFDSGTSWSLLKESGIQTESITASEPSFADVCLEGSDQHRGWFQSMILTAAASSDESDAVWMPYNTLLTHGMVLDQEGKKMSKSIGNVISPMTIVQGGKDKTKQPAYGTDVLRLWAASVEFWRDMPLGTTVLTQTSEILRKIRNSARFILGNMGAGAQTLQSQPPVLFSEITGLGERYVMNELYKLEQLALTSYAEFDFPRIISALSNFTNITLSSLYFDIVKDTLYADSYSSHQRRVVITVIQQILTAMTHIMAPIVPHLAEEIHAQRYGRSSPSVFTVPWLPLPQEWNSLQAEKDMNALLGVRNVVLTLLEKARAAKELGSSLEADVDIILPDGSESSNDLIKLLTKESSFLKTLFIVSDVLIVKESSPSASFPDWVYNDRHSIGDTDSIGIRVRKAQKEKCPRCWTYTREKTKSTCDRCSKALIELPSL